MTSDSDCRTLVMFRLAGQRCAMGLDKVERVIRAAAAVPVRGTTDLVHGLLNVGGQLVPVISLRSWLGLPGTPIQPNDQFVMASTPQLTLALVVDGVENLSVVSGARAAGLEAAIAGEECRIRGFARIEGDIVFIDCLEKFLSVEDRNLILQARAAAED